MRPISVVIIAKDEERNIGRVLAAVHKLAHEIIVVDSGSTDRTIEIATANGAKVVHQDWLGYSAQKNFALGLAQCDWVLSLDADEVLTPELVSEIEQVMSSDAPDKYLGFKIPRVLIIGDVHVRHGGFYPDAQLRLFKKGAGQFNDRVVHEAVKIDGPLADLKHDMLHYAYATVDEFAGAMDHYAQLAVVQAQKTGFNPAKLSYMNEKLHPLWTFFYRYVLRGGFLDGDLGLKLNLIYSRYVKNKIVYLRQSVKDTLA